MQKVLIIAFFNNKIALNTSVLNLLLTVRKILFENKINNKNKKILYTINKIC